jgi:hypothetical protein
MSKEEKNYKIIDFSNCKSLKEAKKILCSYYECSLEELEKMFDNEMIAEMYSSNISNLEQQIDFTESFTKNLVKHSDKYDNQEILFYINKFLSNLVNEDHRFKSLIPTLDKKFPMDCPVIVKKLKGYYFIMNNIDDNYMLVYDKSKIIQKVLIDDIKPIDNIINFLNKDELQIIFKKFYHFLSSNLKIEFIDLFIIFCDYFNAEEKLVYEILDIDHQEQLILGLSSRVSINSKKLF